MYCMAYVMRTLMLSVKRINCIYCSLIWNNSLKTRKILLFLVQLLNLAASLPYLLDVLHSFKSLKVPRSRMHHNYMPTCMYIYTEKRSCTYTVLNCGRPIHSFAYTFICVPRKSLVICSKSFQADLPLEIQIF